MWPSCSRQAPRTGRTTRFFVLGGDHELLQILLESSASCKTMHGDGWRPIHYAAETNYPKIITLLKTHGADVNVLTANKDSALNKAASKGHAKVVKELLAGGARGKQKLLGRGWTAVMSLARSNTTTSLR